MIMVCVDLESTFDIVDRELIRQVIHVCGMSKRLARGVTSFCVMCKYWLVVGGMGILTWLYSMAIPLSH